MDLVEQLRRDAYAPHFTSVGAADLMLKAADELVRLRRALEGVMDAAENHDDLGCHEIARTTLTGN